LAKELRQSIGKPLTGRASVLYLDAGPDLIAALLGQAEIGVPVADVLQERQ